MFSEDIMNSKCYIKLTVGPFFSDLTEEQKTYTEQSYRPKCK
jgi:hypothetical protein